jgi:hypothetical protein
MWEGRGGRSRGGVGDGCDEWSPFTHMHGHSGRKGLPRDATTSVELGAEMVAEGDPLLPEA